MLQSRSAESSPVVGNDPLCRALGGMNDLLERADRAIEDSHRIRSQTKEQLARGRSTSARVKGNLQWIRAECARSRELAMETADRRSSSKFPPATGTMRDRKVQGAPDRTCAPTIRSADPAKGD